jgi:hypothetical protein
MQTGQKGPGVRRDLEPLDWLCRAVKVGGVKRCCVHYGGSECCGCVVVRACHRSQSCRCQIACQAWSDQWGHVYLDLVDMEVGGWSRRTELDDESGVEEEEPREVPVQGWLVLQAH